jgi:hypothetical protein
MTSDELLDFVEQTLRRASTDVREQLLNAPLETLRQRPHPSAWNALECLAHLNAYAKDYLPLIHRAVHLAKARRWTPESPVGSTLAGRQLLRRVNSSRPFRSKKRYDFFAHSFDRDTVKSFLIYQEHLLRTVQEARCVSLNRCKVAGPDSWMRRYPLGNLLEFTAKHTERHIAQAIRAAYPSSISQGTPLEVKA